MRITLALLFLTSNAWAINVGGGLRPGSVGTVQIADGAVNTAKIAANAVDTTKLSLIIPDCSAGGYVKGINPNGTLDCGTPAGAGDATKSGDNAWTGNYNTFYSSVDVRGVFQTSNASFTLATTGIITAGSQSGAHVTFNSGANTRPGSANWYDIYWTNSNYNRQNAWDVTNSSHQITTRGAGLYLGSCTVKLASVIAGGTYCKVALYDSDGTYYANHQVAAPAVGSALATTAVLSLADNHAMSCRMACDGSGEWTLDPAASLNYFVLQKLW